ncbi:NHLP leader peptide family RiPP precursor [Pannonibacter phragmitetus]|uniref:NHLP leader peptide family RiPP precursor n=1 Tax=Pannonibacter phragmitetus TaxID=121719 RepID=UPI003D2EE02B
MTSKTLETRVACEAALRSKAATDANFRAELIRDPAAALGAALPDSMIFRVLEEVPGEVLLVLPAAVDQLSDRQLDAASGGYGPAAAAPPAGSFWASVLDRFRTPGMPAVIGMLK